ncbi:Hypothetical predicted protein, partial [Olea europaea subsp. europaea]
LPNNPQITASPPLHDTIAHINNVLRLEREKNLKSSQRYVDGLHSSFVVGCRSLNESLRRRENRER